MKVTSFQPGRNRGSWQKGNSRPEAVGGGGGWMELLGDREALRSRRDEPDSSAQPKLTDTYRHTDNAPRYINTHRDVEHEKMCRVQQKQGI